MQSLHPFSPSFHGAHVPGLQCWDPQKVDQTKFYQKSCKEFLEKIALEKKERSPAENPEKNQHLTKTRKQQKSTKI